MANVVLYTKIECPFSKDCKKMLEEKGVEYHEITIDDDPAMMQEMQTKSGRKDTPQVFINGSHIGSFDDLKALDSVGKLSEMLNI